MELVTQNTPSVKADAIVAAMKEIAAELSLPEWATLTVHVGGWAKDCLWSLSGDYAKHNISVCDASLGVTAARFAAKLPPTGPALAKQLMREAEEKRAQALKILADCGEKEVAA